MELSESFNDLYILFGMIKALELSGQVERWAWDGMQITKGLLDKLIYIS